MKKLMACPFCGETEHLKQTLTLKGQPCTIMADKAEIKCAKCNVVMTAYAVNEHFAQIHEDMYRKIPTQYAEDVLAERWNSRS